jgi:hypothetical protein
VLVETTEPLAMVTLDRAVAADARRAYPGYLHVRADIYARGWQEVQRRAGRWPPAPFHHHVGQAAFMACSAGACFRATLPSPPYAAHAGRR